MYANLGALLPIALGIAINPASIIAVILLLTSNHGHAKALAYLTGWLVGLFTLVIALGLPVISWNNRRNAASEQFTTWVILIVGITMLVMAYIQWRQRPPADAEVVPIMWLRMMPQATWFMALSAGLFFGLFNVKNLMLTAVAVLLIVEAAFGLNQRLSMVLIFLAVASSGIAAPVLVSAIQNERAGATLADWENKLAIHNVRINCIVLVIIAVQMLIVCLGRVSGI